MPLLKNRISVAIATYNGEKYLRQQLDSIYHQSLLPFEVIVCDDCSTDNTLNILQDYCEKYDLIYYANEKNLGYAKNFEKVMSLCKGEYTTLSDQDDIWLKNKLLVLFDNIKKIESANPAKAILVHSEAMVVDQSLNVIKNKFIGKRAGLRSGINNLLFYNAKVQGSSVLFNSKFKDLLLPIPDTIQQYDFYASIISETIGIRHFIPTPLMLYRQHDNNQVGAGNLNKLSKVRKLINKDFVIAEYEEYKCLEAFKNQFFHKLNQDSKNKVNAYLKFFKSNKFNKLLLVVSNRFGSGGSVLRLLIKIVLSNQYIKY